VGGQTRRVHGRRVHGRRVHGRMAQGRRVHGRSTVGGGDLDPMVGAPKDAREELNQALNGGAAGQTTSELVLGLLVAAQATQIEDLRERIERLESGG
jgi:hypothetical protein